MDFTTISQLVGSVGFPIAMCFYMAFTNNKTLEKLEETINNNTTIMTRVLDRLNMGGGGGGE